MDAGSSSRPTLFPMHANAGANLYRFRVETKYVRFQVVASARKDGTRLRASNGLVLMRLTPERSYSLLEKHSCFASEACDKCGQILGPIRFTRRGDNGVWCSRGCRDGAEGHEPGTCKHCRAKLPEGKRKGTAFCDDACRKAARRQSGLLQTSQTDQSSRTKPSIYAAFSPGKLRDGISGHSEAVSRV